MKLTDVQRNDCEFCTVIENQQAPGCVTYIGIEDNGSCTEKVQTNRTRYFTRYAAKCHLQSF